MWYVLKSEKNSWLALQHIQIPHLISSLATSECSTQLNSSSQLSPVFFPKQISSCVSNQTAAPNLIQAGVTILQMKLYEFILPENKDSLVIFLNILYTTWSHVYNIHTPLIHVKSAYLYIDVLHSKQSSWLSLVQWTLILLLLK